MSSTVVQMKLLLLLLLPLSTRATCPLIGRRNNYPIAKNFIYVHKCLGAVIILASAHMGMTFWISCYCCQWTFNIRSTLHLLSRLGKWADNFGYYMYITSLLWCHPMRAVNQNALKRGLWHLCWLFKYIRAALRCKNNYNNISSKRPYLRVPFCMAA